MSTFPSSSLPRPIEGTPGTRARVLLGDTGLDFVLVANSDDGTNEWQAVVVSDSGSVDRLARQIQNCENKGRYVTEIDLHAATGAWYVAGKRRDGSGPHSWWNFGSSDADDAVRRLIHPDTEVSLGSRRDEYGNVQIMYVVVNGRNNFTYCNIPDRLANLLQRVQRNDSIIHCVRLFDRSGFFISESEGESWGGLQPGVANELAKPGRVRDVAIAKNGSWVVLRDDRVEASPGVAAKLMEHLSLYYTRQKSRKEARVQEIQAYHAAALLEQSRLALVALDQERLREEAERAEAEARERERLEAEMSDLIDVLRPSCTELRRLRTDLETRTATFTRLKDSIHRHLEPLSSRARAYVEESLDWDERTEAPPLPAGTTHRATSGSDTASAPCVICTDSPALLALVPCGHLCLCEDCSVQFLHSTSRTCPLCRVHATSTLRIYRQD